jgi:hypothetical protein
MVQQLLLPQIAPTIALGFGRFHRRHQLALSLRIKLKGTFYRTRGPPMILAAFIWRSSLPKTQCQWAAKQLSSSLAAWGSSGTFVARALAPTSSAPATRRELCGALPAISDTICALRSEASAAHSSATAAAESGEAAFKNHRLCGKGV